MRSAVATTALFGVGALAFASCPPAAAADGPCPVSEVEYDVVASVYVRDTPFGAGNGVHPLGSGRMKLRIEEGASDKGVTLISYAVSNRLVVDARVAMLSTKVVTVSQTTTARDSCGGSARGNLRDGTLTWRTSVLGYRSDGTIDCSGSICGAFGAPPRGTSPLHDVPPALVFSPFTFSPDGATFTMPYTLLSKSDSPRQTTRLALSGRRVRQQCAGLVGACSGHGVTDP